MILADEAREEAGTGPRAPDQGFTKGPLGTKRALDSWRKPHAQTEMGRAHLVRKERAGEEGWDQPVAGPQGQDKALPRALGRQPRVCRKQGRDVGGSPSEKCHPSGQMAVTWQGRDFTVVQGSQLIRPDLGQ